MIFDITSTETLPLEIPLPESVKAALTAEGVTPPEKVVLHLREATLEERSLPQKAVSDEDGVVLMMMARAEDGTDERVVRALARKMTASSIGAITEAFITGEYSDPKKIRARLRQTRTG